MLDPSSCGNGQRSSYHLYSGLLPQERPRLATAGTCASRLVIIAATPSSNHCGLADCRTEDRVKVIKLCCTSHVPGPPPPGPARTYGRAIIACIGQLDGRRRRQSQGDRRICEPQRGRSALSALISTPLAPTPAERPCGAADRPCCFQPKHHLSAWRSCSCPWS